VKFPAQIPGMGSIPIARSKKPVDAVGLTDFPAPNCPVNCYVLDAVGRAAARLYAFWTRARARNHRALTRPASARLECAYRQSTPTLELGPQAAQVLTPRTVETHIGHVQEKPSHSVVFGEGKSAES
jgi:hypothetical protein